MYGPGFEPMTFGSIVRWLCRTPIGLVPPRQGPPARLTPSAVARLSQLLGPPDRSWSLVIAVALRTGRALPPD